MKSVIKGSGLVMGTVAAIALGGQTLPAQSSEPTLPPNSKATDIQPVARLVVDQQSRSEGKRGRFSYGGLGGAIGFSNDAETSLGDGGFALVGKVGFSENFSLRTSAVFNFDATIMVAAAGELPLRDSRSGRTLLIPFFGAGLVADTGETFHLGPLITTGVDIPLTRRLTGTARVNFGFVADSTDVGLILGVAYNFPKQCGGVISPPRKGKRC